jgi:hypothetical protein
MIDWRKSTRSESGNCVEVGQPRKSTHSVNNGQCVEVGHAAGAVIAVRDTTDRAGGTLMVPAAAWAEFTARTARER